MLNGPRARFQCAAITRGCMAFLVMPCSPQADLEHLDPEAPEDRHILDLLAMNGWRLDHGRWVCPADHVAMLQKERAHDEAMEKGLATLRASSVSMAEANRNLAANLPAFMEALRLRGAIWSISGSERGTGNGQKTRPAGF